MHSKKKTRFIAVAVVLATLIFCAALGGFLLWYEGNEKDAAREASDAIAVALKGNDRDAAPEGAADYVSGTRAYFGPVKDAKTVDVRQVDNYGADNTSNNDRSWWTSTLFLRTERGAALLLVTFDDSSDPRDAPIDSIRELSPGKVADGALSKTEGDDAKRGFASRGGRTANSLVLDGTFPEERAGSRRRRDVPPPPTAADEKRWERQRLEGRRRIECMKRANGDIDKLKKCSEM